MFSYAGISVMVRQSLTRQTPPHQAHLDSSMIELPHRAKSPEMTSGKKARMEAENTWIAVWVALHIGALAAAYGTRVAAGSRVEGLTQAVFYAAMLMVGLAIWACQQVHAGAWGLSAVTLIAMVVTAVVDFEKLGEHRSAGQMY
jgi:hypothetical protein